MDKIIAVLHTYYFWIAVEAAAAVVLLFFTGKYSKRKKVRQAELISEAESERYSKLDNQLINKKGSDK